jgi:hypothetical protein
VFPILFLVIFGAGFGRIVGQMAGEWTCSFMYPGIVAQAVLISSLFAGVSVVSDPRGWLPAGDPRRAAQPDRDRPG